ncbi:MAG: hypothetical protein A3I61_17330 [Acidobacteria bacterium RIFCSPLOWO2_02_FULL_68_18]|nr:MAG: hypothetical protein A3I61_17330 [Acidobacteria bacterium RIFCSPLOWO2_02_FULL_68_18]OFW50442.1 MAG: hypothetical protein A3G77_11905 [Acidobacteria bacterium RIFCSPLOWO2_12_FULL_68_19]
MDLIDEQHKIGIGGRLVNQLAKSSLELAAMGGSRHKIRDFNLHEFEPAKKLRRARLGEALREPLDNGRLSDTSLPEQQDVTLRRALEISSQRLDLAAPAHDGREATRLREGCQISNWRAGDDFDRHGRPTGAAGFSGRYVWPHDRWRLAEE